MGIDYTGQIIKNKNGSNVQITTIKSRNNKNEIVYGYICPKCGTESYGTIDKIKRNKGCIFCKGKQISNAELLSNNVINDSLIKNNDNIILISEYLGKNKNVLLECRKHNIKFYKKPSSFLYFKTKICPECIKENKKISKNKKYSKSDIIDYLNKLGYTWNNPVDYKDASSILELKCKKCGSLFKSNISSIIKGRKCKVCSGFKNKSTDDFKKEVFNLVGNEYSVLGEYKNNKKHIKMKHNKCGFVWSVIPTNFIYGGRRCPKCKISHGEEEIANYLDSHNIKYHREYSFDDCCYKRKLRFDFYLPELNKCIEFQGKQHYVSVEYMGGEREFKMRKIRDNIKSDYCKRNNLILIKIPYDKVSKVQDILDSLI